MKMQVKYVQSTQKRFMSYFITASHTIFNQRPPVSESIMGYMSVPSVHQSSSLKKLPAIGHRRDNRETHHTPLLIISLLWSFKLYFTVSWVCESPSGSPESPHMTSTKNSLGFPMAMRKDWRDAVSSGGTEDRSRPGGDPGAVVTGIWGWGGRPGGPHTRLWAWEWVLWTLRMVCVLWALCSLAGAAERSLGALSLFSDSLPLPPDLAADSCVPTTAFVSFLLALRFDPLLRLPVS